MPGQRKKPAKGGAALASAPAYQPPGAAPWADPTYRINPATMSGTLPWWLAGATGAGGGGVGGVPGAGAAPSVAQPGGSIDYGPGGERPDEGADTLWSGGNPYGGRSPYATDVSAQTMGRLLGLFGAPTGTTRGLQWYADRRGDDNPYDTATPHNTGPVYYGPTRHPGVGGDFEYGQQYGHDWAQESANHWAGMNPGQGIGTNDDLSGGGIGSGDRAGIGGGGSGLDPYAGTASPWWWGASLI